MQEGCKIARGTALKGNVTGPGNLVLDGQVIGSIAVGGNLHIAKRGTLLGDSQGNEMQIDGVVEGNASAHNRITLGRNARVLGTLRAKSIVLIPGAQFSGEIEMEVILPEELLESLNDKESGDA